MELQFHNANAHIASNDSCTGFFIAIVDNNLLNEKKRVNEMAYNMYIING